MKDQIRSSQMSDKTRILHFIGRIGGKANCPFCGSFDVTPLVKDTAIYFKCGGCGAFPRYSRDKVEKVRGQS